MVLRKQQLVRPAGAPDHKEIDEAYKELLEGLYVAQQEFSREGDGGLAGCQRACHAVVRFLGVRWENPELAAPFLALHAAFSDLMGGKSPELFSKNVDLRKRSQSSARGEIRFW